MLSSGPSRSLAAALSLALALALALRRSGDPTVLGRWSGQWTLAVASASLLAVTVCAVALLRDASRRVGQRLSGIGRWVAGRSRRQQALLGAGLAALAALLLTADASYQVLGRAGGWQRTQILLVVGPLMAVLLLLVLASRRPGRSAAAFAVWGVLGLLGFEALLAALRHDPDFARRVPGGLRLAKSLYQGDVGIPFADAQADDQLWYTLARDATFEFTATEFTTRYRTNSQGLRDDEQSLDAPEIVVLGDSFAMGWGVDASESFPGRLEALTGRKVLNTAVTSYGTARQVHMLERVDLSRVRCVIVQYCNNDYDENKAFHERGNELAPLSDGMRRAFAEQAAVRPGYFPFKYTVHVLDRLPRWMGTPRRPPPDPPAAELFLNALAHAPVDLSGVQLIALQLNESALRDDFLQQVRAGIEAGDYPGHIERLELVDARALLEPADWFALDNHIRASGHAKLAEHLAERLP